MNNFAIKAENLSKANQLGEIGTCTEHRRHRVRCKTEYDKKISAEIP